MRTGTHRGIATLIVMAMVMAGFSAAAGGAFAATENNLLKVAGVSWYGPNSTEQAVPGTDYVPLVISFIVLTNSSLGQSMSVSVNLTSQFSYSNVTGGSAQTTVTIAPVVQGSFLTIVQLVNISATASNGLYTEQLSYVLQGGTGGAVTGSSQFTLPLLGTVNLVPAGSTFGSASTPIPGTPGMKFVPLSMAIENTGNSPVTNISATYTPSGYLYGSPQTSYVSAMPSFGFATLTFLVSISSDATLGFVQQSVIAHYNGANHTIQFNVPLTGYANISMINYFTNPPAIYQGEKYIQLTVLTANSGNSFASDLTVGASAAHFDVLTAPYRLPAYPSGYQLNFTFLLNAMNYTGPAPVTVTIGGTQYVIPLYLKQEGALDISSTVPVFNPGGSNQLEIFTLTNGGNTTMYDLNIHLLSPGIISIHIPSSNPFAALTANNVTFAELKQGQSVTVTFSMDTASSAPVGSYPAQLLVTWMHNDSATQLSKTYTFSEVVKKSGVQQFTDSFALTPLNTVVLVVILAAVIAVAAVVLARSRRRKRGEKVSQRRLAENGEKKE